MTRSLPILALTSILLVACSTSKPAAAPEPIDPYTDPTIVGAVDEAMLQGSAEAEAGARVGRRIGRVAGVFAAVFGGPESESIDDMVDRYRMTRDAAEVTGALIGAANGATEGAKRGYELDVQFAELHQIEGLEVTRPYPDEIEVRMASVPSEETMSAIASVLEGREARAIDIEAAGDAALEIRESLIARNVPTTSLSAHRIDERTGVLLRIRYRA